MLARPCLMPLHYDVVFPLILHSSCLSVAAFMLFSSIILIVCDGVVLSLALLAMQQKLEAVSHLLHFLIW